MNFGIVWGKQEWNLYFAVYLNNLMINLNEQLKVRKLWLEHEIVRNQISKSCRTWRDNTKSLRLRRRRRLLLLLLLCNESRMMNSDLGCFANDNSLIAHAPFFLNPPYQFCYFHWKLNCTLCPYKSISIAHAHILCIFMFEIKTKYLFILSIPNRLNEAVKTNCSPYCVLNF